MQKVMIEKLSQDEAEQKGITEWPVWEKEASVFDWYYDAEEKCYLLEGDVAVTCANGDVVEFGKGDFVTFPKGMKCKWEIRQGVRKHYNFS